MNLERMKFGLLLLAVECVVIVSFVAFVGYDIEADGSHFKNNIDPTYGGVRPHTNTIARYDSRNCYLYFFIESSETWLTKKIKLSISPKSFNFTVYQDVQVMVFVGFGFLMNFLRKYGYSAIGLTMIVGAVAIQWSILCRGLFHHGDNGLILIDITT